MDGRGFDNLVLGTEGTTHFSYTRSNFCRRWSLSRVTLNIKMPRERGRISGYYFCTEERRWTRSHNSFTSTSTSLLLAAPYFPVWSC